MAGTRPFGSSDMAAVLLQNKGISSGGIEALLSRGLSHGAFHGSMSVMNFEDVQGNRPEQPFCRRFELEETGDEDWHEGVHQTEKKRRLTAIQVQFLERSFALENKLDPEKKAQLARDLELQPRQVAIWFQNRRARWKTKQLEKDYEALRSSYDALKTDYDSMLNEKEKLQTEVLSLTNKLLLREMDISILEPFDLQFQNSVSNAMCEMKGTKAQVTACKQEDRSSANSTVSDSESPNCVDQGAHSMLMQPVGSCSAFEPDRSGLSHAGEVDEAKACSFLGLEDSLNDYGFPVEDDSYWDWP